MKVVVGWRRNDEPSTLGHLMNSLFGARESIVSLAGVFVWLGGE